MSIVIPTGIKKIIQEKNKRLKGPPVDVSVKKTVVDYDHLIDKLYRLKSEEPMDDLDEEYMSPWEIIDIILSSRKSTIEQKRLARQAQLDVDNVKQMRRV